ncbi:MAG: hypothetical protein E4H02_12495 [Lentisphaerales bacterium]|nr:MAG: hypothetical protein E4H02_12495 [Lentisphaerales bacterium]
MTAVPLCVLNRQEFAGSHQLWKGHGKRTSLAGKSWPAQRVLDMIGSLLQLHWSMVRGIPFECGGSEMCRNNDLVITLALVALTVGLAARANTTNGVPYAEGFEGYSRN